MKITKTLILINKANGIVALFWIIAGINIAYTSTNTTLVTINKSKITTEDANKYIFKHHKMVSKSKDVKANKEKIINKLINDRLIVLEAQSMGLTNEDWIKKELDEVQIKLGIQEYLKKNPPPVPKADKKDVEEYYKKFYQKIQIQTVAILDSIEAENIMKKIKSGSPMDSIAKDVSLDSRKFEGGLHKLKKYADIDTVFRNRAVLLKKKEFAKIFKYKDVYMVMRILDKQPANMKEFSKYKPGIEKYLADLKKQSTWDAYIDGLAKKYPVKVNNKALKSILNDSSIASTNKFLNATDNPVIEHNKDMYISDRKFRFNISRQIMSNSGQPFQELVTNALKGLKAELLLSIASEKNGFFKDPTVVSKYNQSRDSLLIEAYLKDMVVDHITFNQEEFERYYKENPDEFRKDPEVLILELQTTTKDSISNYYKRLQKGANFNYILKNKPDVTPGDLIPKWVSLASFPDSVKAKLIKAKKSEIVGPLQLAKGWILFEKLNEKQGELKPFDQVQLELREIFFRKKFDENLTKVLSILKKNFKIQRHEKNIKNYLAEKHD